MATGKLIGNDDYAFQYNCGDGIFYLVRFQCVANGNMTQFKVKSNAFGYVKCALYADNAGEPGNLITAMNTGQLVTGGDSWQTLSFTSTPVTSGTYAWLAMNMDTAGAIRSTDAFGICRYKTGQTYSTFNFPNPAGSGFTNATASMGTAGWGIKVLIPSSISQPVGYGSPKLKLTVKPSSILQALAYGTPTILTNELIIQPSDIVQPISIGTPTLRYLQILSPLSIVQPVAIGMPWVGIFGFIRPQSTIQQISIGNLTILKYVWHIILDGQYATGTPGVNRAYIIGRDQYGNPVYGTAANTDEVALVGERLDFHQELSIPTTAQARDVASAVLSKMRLMGKKGTILIPPNCGQELWDVVQISDYGANQSAVKFRIIGIRLEYNHRDACYQHKLTLGAP